MTRSSGLWRRAWALALLREFYPVESSHVPAPECGVYEACTTRGFRTETPRFVVERLVTTGRLRVQAPGHVGVGHAADAFHQGTGSEIHPALLSGLPHPGERARHDLLQARDDLALLPEVVLQTLDPLEVGDDHPARVAQDVGDHGHPAVPEDEVGLGGGGTVRALRDDEGLHARRLALADHRVDRGGDEDGAGLLEDLVVADGLPAREAGHAPGGGHVGLA